MDPFYLLLGYSRTPLELPVDVLRSGVTEMTTVSDLSLEECFEKLRALEPQIIGQPSTLTIEELRVIGVKAAQMKFALTLIIRALADKHYIVMLRNLAYASELKDSQDKLKDSQDKLREMERKKEEQDLGNLAKWLQQYGNGAVAIQNENGAAGNENGAAGNENGAAGNDNGAANQMDDMISNFDMNLLGEKSQHPE